MSRELREVLPALRPCLPCPAVWEPVADAGAVPAETVLPVDQAAAGRVLLDATEQRVSRPSDDTLQKRLSWLQIRPPLLRGALVGMVETAQHRHSAHRRG